MSDQTLEHASLSKQLTTPSSNIYQDSRSHIPNFADQPRYQTCKTPLLVNCSRYDSGCYSAEYTIGDETFAVQQVTDDSILNLFFFELFR